MSSALRTPWILDSVGSLIGNSNTGVGVSQGEIGRVNSQVIDTDDKHVGLILLSDKRHFIWAKLSDKCVQELRNERSRLAESFASLKGSLLTISKFTVCMDFLRDSPDAAICEYSLTNALRLGYSDRSVCLHLRIEGVTLLGCDSLRICGRPTNIITDASVNAVLRKTSPEILHRKLVKLQSHELAHKCPETLPLPLFGTRTAQRYDICSTTQLSNPDVQQLEDEADVSSVFGPPAEVTFASSAPRKDSDAESREKEARTKTPEQGGNKSAESPAFDAVNTQAFISTEDSWDLPQQQDDDVGSCKGGTHGIPTQAFLPTPAGSKLKDSVKSCRRKTPISSARSSSPVRPQTGSRRTSRESSISALSAGSVASSDSGYGEASTGSCIKEAHPTQSQPLSGKAKSQETFALGMQQSNTNLPPFQPLSQTPNPRNVESTSMQARRVLARPPEHVQPIHRSSQTKQAEIVTSETQTAVAVSKCSGTQTKILLCHRGTQTSEIPTLVTQKWRTSPVKTSQKKRKLSQLNLSDITWVASYFTKA